MKTVWRGVLLVALAFGLAHSAAASVVTINAVNSGWYSSSGSSNGSLNNTCAGCGTRRNWLGFDLSSFSGSVSAATLSVYSDPQNSFTSNFQWWDVSTNYASLGTSSAATYADLGSGTLLAQGTHSGGIYNNYVLNAAGLADLTAALGNSWAIGRVNASSTEPNFGYNSGVATDPAYYQLTLNLGPSIPTPAPASLALLGLGLVLLGARRKRVS